MVIGVGKISAQRVHSSQFYSIPLLLNPALTGNSDYNLRGGISYRNQWNSITIPFLSQAAYLDGKLSAPILGASYIGVGGMIFNDKAGEGSLKSTQVMAAASYNKSLNAGNTLFLHLGLSVEFLNKAVDYNRLVFDDQLLPGSAVSGELGKVKNQSLFYVDFALGGQVTYFRGANRFFMGMSINHLNQPNESFYEVTNNLKRRFAWHGGMERRLLPRIYMRPEFMFTSEKGANEWILGSNFMMPYGKKGWILHYGMWYRFTNDVIPVFGVQRRRLKLLVSYDFNVSQLQTATSHKGGFEISLRYNYNYSNPREVRKLRRRQRVKSLGKKAISCPKFSTE